MSNHTNHKKTTRNRRTSTLKNFVLDTNVLIQEPYALTNFDEHNVWLPHDVIEELDRLKTGDDARALQARETFRIMKDIFKTPEDTRNGYSKPAGGEVRFVNPNSLAVAAMCDQFPEMDKADNRILASAMRLVSDGKKNVVVVSRDVAVRTKALILGLNAEDFVRDQADPAVVKKQQAEASFEVTGHQAQGMESTGTLNLDPDLTTALDKSFVTYLKLTHGDAPGRYTPARYLGAGRFRKLNYAPITVQGGRTLKARNLEQKFLFDAVHDNSVPLITLIGVAGTGKTLASIAGGIEGVQNGTYDKLMVGRAVVPIGNDIGFLPGDKDEKLESWMRPAIDNIDFIFGPRSQEIRPGHEGQVHSARKDKKGAGHGQPKQEGRGGQPQQQGFVKLMRPHERLIANGTLQLEIMSRMRGANIAKSFFVVDEAQNLTPAEAKMLVTRMAEGSKIILIGDPDQIDARYLTKLSNGLVHTMVKMAGDPGHVHINLLKGERSRISEAAAKRM